MMSKYDIYKKLLEVKNFVPDVIIDAGYGIGEWSNMIHQIYPNAKLIGIEANENATGKLPPLEDRIIENVLLWDMDGLEVDFFQSIREGGWCTGDSAFRENSQHYGDNNTLITKKTTKTIQTLCKEHGIEKIDLLKLDVQGSELNCLLGAGSMLSDVGAIEIECSVVNYNIGAPDIYRIMSFMHENNFSMYDVLDLHRAFTNPIGDLIQMDLLFINEKTIKREF